VLRVSRYRVTGRTPPDAGGYDALQEAVVDRVVAVPESLAR